MKNVSIVPVLFFFIGLFAINACQTDHNEASAAEDERPHEPWVFRSVLDGYTRSITFALDKHLWVAYNTSNGAMYKAWDGTVNFEGAVYNSIHGPQPITYGSAYFINDHKSPWILKSGGQKVDFEFNYKGHKYDGDQAMMTYEFITKNGQKIILAEQPEVIKNEAGRLGLERTFTIVEKPENLEISLNINLSSLLVYSDIETDGDWRLTKDSSYQFGKKELLNVDGTLTLNDETTRFASTFGSTASLTNENDPKQSMNVTSLDPGAGLINKSGCKTCHNEQVKTVGPAYVDVAKRYADTDDNITLLANKVIKGGSGVWGNQMMTPHPDLTMPTAKRMIKYILSLADPSENLAEAKEEKMEPFVGVTQDSFAKMNTVPGAVVYVYGIPKGQKTLPDMANLKNPKMAGVMPNFDNLNGNKFKGLKDHFAIVSKGFIEIKQDQEVSFRLWTDDGSRLTIGDKVVIDHDGLHSVSMKQVTIQMTAGYHPFVLEYFQHTDGNYLSLNWKPDNASEWKVIPADAFSHLYSDQEVFMKSDMTLPMSVNNIIPGDQRALQAAHPAFTVSLARPYDFTPKVGGLDFLSDGTIVVSTWDQEGAVYLVKGVESGDPDEMTATKIASGLAEPLGLKVVDDEIYIMQKQEMTKLIDLDGDEIIDEYQTLCDDWGVTNNFHEFGFGLAYKDGNFYGALATGILPGGASMPNQNPDRGSIIEVSKETGEYRIFANGFRTPNGIGLDGNGEIFMADNEGDWLPSSKINHVEEGAFYGQRSVDFEGTKDKKVHPPVVWLPHFEIGNSPSTPSYLNIGPYKDQMIHGEVTHGGIKRVFVEEIDGIKQGCVFRFCQGLEAGVNRIAWGPDGALYAGGIGDSGNWGQAGKKRYGLQRLEYNGTSVFEMLAVKAKSNGLEIEFTEPLKEGDGWQKTDYQVKQWSYKPTKEYGGPKIKEQELNIKSVSVSDDRKKVFLELPNIKAGHVQYILLRNHFVSDKNHELWSTEAWYTMNNIPKNLAGQISSKGFTVSNNGLTPIEQQQGWELLFDGQSLDQWHKFKHDDTANCKWRADNGTIHYSAGHEGEWGDLVTNDSYENYELQLEWKISNCGNSGIMYHVQDTDEYNATWKTGPEMQILDDTCHPDTKYVTHQAGDLYDMKACKFKTVNPAGEWNKVRIQSNEGKMEFWLNGYNVVSFTMHDDSWERMIEGSKFNRENDPDMVDFGKFTKGHIALQDHGDDVWFRNVKIRKL